MTTERSKYSEALLEAVILVFPGLLGLVTAWLFLFAVQIAPANAQEKAPCKEEAQCTDAEIAAWKVDIAARKIDVMKKHSDLCKKSMALGLLDNAEQCWRDHWLMFPPK
jgi:hypothetical protein